MITTLSIALTLKTMFEEGKFARDIVPTVEIA